MKAKTFEGFFKFLTILIVVLGTIRSVSLGFEARNFWVFLESMVIIGLFAMIFLAFSVIFDFLGHIDFSVSTNGNALQKVKEKLEKKDEQNPPEK